MRTILVWSKSGLLVVFCCGVLLLVPYLLGASPGTFVAPFNHIKSLTSTIPGNGDVNPYGVALVKRTVGSLTTNHILVSNFNNSANLQGTGTTIMDISPDGKARVFAQLNPVQLAGVCPDGIGLTTALAVLRSGWVIVGSLPTSDGMAATAKAGCLLVLDSNGNAVESIGGDAINGPWDMTAVEGDGWAVLFVTNVLNGTVAAGGGTVNKGNVLRISLEVEEGEMPQVTAQRVIASGFPERTDPAALVIGPTGVGFSSDGVLYVADTLNNRIAAIPDALSRTTDAGTGNTVSEGDAINGPLGLAVAPNGHILITNGGDGNLVEVTPDGEQVDVLNIDTTQTGGGTLFGLALGRGRSGIYFVNDGNNTLDRLF